MRVVIKTDPSRRGWIGGCLESVASHDVMIVQTKSFELGAISYAREERYDRFLFLQDSCRVLHPDFWTHLDKYDSALVMPRPCCYLAVFELDILDLMTIPVIPRNDKEAAIHYETVFMDEYARLYQEWRHRPIPVVFPDLTDARALSTNNFQVVNGENRLVLENNYFRKYKGTFR